MTTQKAEARSKTKVSDIGTEKACAAPEEDQNDHSFIQAYSEITNV